MCDRDLVIRVSGLCGLIKRCMGYQEKLQQTHILHSPGTCRISKIIYKVSGLYPIKKALYIS